MLTVIIPASNEARVLPNCLRAVLASEGLTTGAEIVVVSNGSRDGTAEVAATFQEQARARGWDLTVLDLPQGGKLRALNAGDLAARGDTRVYLDADVTVSPRLLASLVRVLDRPEAAYAAGRVTIRARGTISRAYARLWSRVPFMTKGVPGCGLFAVNAPGRARWGDWPAIIADDLYARLHFAPSERHLVPEPYDWPIAEGLHALTRVRRRQDRGTAEIAERFPRLLANEDKLPITSAGLLGLILRDPVGFVFYATVALAVRAWPGDGSWSRGR
ncbi:glycosyltransferase family 2 protein [Rubellimicrobium arenae]|uniref:glycosyltransferase family 2 protein n=1 Tax=Rubellimicrobium arenae TaxID=2817372 RepID=UPI001B303A87|nr:glycosyltransferase family 2 protein [Rubellimicrobium arenae]